MERPIERRGRRPRPGRRAAGIAVALPRIAGQRMMARKPGRQHAVVRHRRLGEQHGPSLLEARGRRRVGRGRGHVARRRADRSRIALGRDVVLDRRRHAVERADRFALQPTRLRGARLLQRALGRIEPGRRDLRLERLDAGDDRGHGLGRRQGLRTVGVQQFDSRQPERLRRAHTLPAHFHDISDRSLTKIGAFFHRPLRSALATVTLGSWNRKALTASAASCFCASPSAAL